MSTTPVQRVRMGGGGYSIFRKTHDGAADGGAVMRKLKDAVERVRPGVIDAYERKLHRRGLTPWKRWEPLVPEEALTDCVDHALGELLHHRSRDELGDYLEFGVSRGTSMACVHRAIRKRDVHMRLIGFDSFEGMPPEAAQQGWFPGQYSSTITATRRYLRRHGVPLRDVELVKGWFDDTLTDATRRRLQIGTASLIMIDCDIYTSSKTALDFCEPHIGEHAVIMFDDWGWRDGAVGQREAFHEFLADHPDLSAEPLPSYLDQARVFMVSRTPAEHGHDGS
jgi:O-methyltransferase